MSDPKTKRLIGAGIACFTASAYSLWAGVAMFGLLLFIEGVVQTELQEAK